MIPGLLDMVKSALNMTSSSDDAELVELIEAAEAKYAAHVGPLPGTTVVTLSGGGSMHLLPRNVTEVTSAAYADGESIDVNTLDLEPATGILYGSLTYGSRNVRVTVEVADLPMNHQAAIVADVTEYWTRTQRAGGGGRPQFGGDGFEPEIGRPVVMFPRIRALVAPGIA